MYLPEHFRYRGLSITELDEIIYFYQAHEGNKIDVSNVILSKPAMTAQKLAQKILDMIREVDDKWQMVIETDQHAMIMALVVDIEALCKEQVKER